MSTSRGGTALHGQSARRYGGRSISHPAHTRNGKMCQSSMVYTSDQDAVNRHSRLCTSPAITRFQSFSACRNHKVIWSSVHSVRRSSRKPFIKLTAYNEKPTRSSTRCTRRKSPRLEAHARTTKRNCKKRWIGSASQIAPYHTT